MNLNDIFKNNGNVELLDGDSLTFFSISNQINNYVVARGAIRRPGDFQFYNGMKVKDLISRADGLIGTSYMEMANITRLNEDNTLSQIVVNLNEVLNDNPNDNIFLKSNDILEILNLESMQYKTDVSITGHVLFPGIKMYKKGMTVKDLIFLGGGFENKNHLSKTYFERADYIRKIDEENSELIIFNLDSVLNDKSIFNTILNMGDQIKIYNKDFILGTKNKTIQLTGAVKNPGPYIMHQNQSLKDILFEAGITEDTTFLNQINLDRAHIYRLTNEEQYSQKIITFSLSKLLNNKLPNLKIIDGDIINLFYKSNYLGQEQYSIEGAINRPGVYSLRENSNIFDLILEAGGILPNVNIFKIEIARTIEKTFQKKSKKDTKFSEIIDFGVFDHSSFSIDNKVLRETILKKNDIIYIRNTPNLSVQKIVNISGSVLYPGNYPITNANEKITDIINRAGGLTNEAFPFGSSFKRDKNQINISFRSILKNPNSRNNFIVLEGDSINIVNKPDMVEITGEVNAPGFYKFTKNKRFEYYINNAGGMKENGSRKTSYVIYANGISVPIKTLRPNPKVYDGSKIVIGSKEINEPLNVTEYTSTLTQILSDLVQTTVLLQLLANN